MQLCGKARCKKCSGVAKTRCDFCAYGGQFINDVKVYFGNESRWGMIYILIKLERVRVRFFSKLCREGVFCATYPKQRVKIWMKSHFKFCAKSATIYIRKNNPNCRCASPTNYTPTAAEWRILYGKPFSQTHL